MSGEFGTCSYCAADIDEPGWICCGMTFCTERCMEDHRRFDCEEP